MSLCQIPKRRGKKRSSIKAWALQLPVFKKKLKTFIYGFIYLFAKRKEYMVGGIEERRGERPFIM